MVGLTILFPGMVMHYKGEGSGVDPATIKIEVPGFGGSLGLPDNGGGLGLPGGLQLPAGNPLDSGSEKPAEVGGEKPATDLSSPPSFN